MGSVIPDTRALGVHQSVILVADDEPLIRNLVTLLMQREGYLVISPADGHEGLELSRKYPGKTDLVITDADMPRMNGTDLCGHLMEERPGIKMLIMSGTDMSEIVSQNPICHSYPAIRWKCHQSQSPDNAGRSSSASDPPASRNPGEMNACLMRNAVFCRTNTPAHPIKAHKTAQDASAAAR